MKKNEIKGPRVVSMTGRMLNSRLGIKVLYIPTKDGNKFNVIDGVEYCTTKAQARNIVNNFKETNK